MRYGTKAWIGLGAYLVAAEAFAPKGEMLSERVDDWLMHHPAKCVVYGAVTVTALHLLNILHPRLDPISKFFELVESRYDRTDYAGIIRLKGTR